MRVLCSTIHGIEMEGEVIGGEHFDPVTETCDLDSLMVTLCLACHAKVTRTLFVQNHWPPFLRQLWREQHPAGHEQTSLDFASKSTAAVPVPLLQIRVHSS